MSEYLRHDLAHHGGVASQQFQARLAGALRDARGDDHYPAAGQVGVVASRDAQGMREGDGMQDVICFGLRSRGVPVDQHDLATNAAHEQGIGGGRSDQAAADNPDFHWMTSGRRGRGRSRLSSRICLRGERPAQRGRARSETGPSAGRPAPAPGERQS